MCKVFPTRQMANSHRSTGFHSGRSTAPCISTEGMTRPVQHQQPDERGKRRYLYYFYQLGWGFYQDKFLESSISWAWSWPGVELRRNLLSFQSDQKDGMSLRVDYDSRGWDSPSPYSTSTVLLPISVGQKLLTFEWWGYIQDGKVTKV